MVESLPSLLPPSASVMTTTLAMRSVVGLASTATAKKSVPPPFGGTSGTTCRHGVPAGLLSPHDQPGELAPALYLVEAGTVSVIVTPVAVAVPTLTHDSV